MEERIRRGRASSTFSRSPRPRVRIDRGGAGTELVFGKPFPIVEENLLEVLSCPLMVDDERGVPIAEYAVT